MLLSMAQVSLLKRPTPTSRKHSMSRTANAMLQSASRASNPAFPMVPFSLARHGMGDLVDVARVLVYEHGDVSNGTERGLEYLANDMLRVLRTERQDCLDRPIFFLCHSVGGLVVKMALDKAPRYSYPQFRESCYGICFFATPHGGSKFLAADEYRLSIQKLLKLAKPLPRVLMKYLAPGHPILVRIDEVFRELASEMRVWSFYEAVDSKLTEQSFSAFKDVPITAPIASMRSALLGLRHEKVFGLQATHASCAGFGRHNTETARMFLQDLAAAVRAADELRRRTHVEVKPAMLSEEGLDGPSTEHGVIRRLLRPSLRMEEQRDVVKIHGFYEPASLLTVEARPVLRVFVAKRAFREVCDTAPEQLLQQQRDDQEWDSVTLHRAPSLKASALVYRPPDRIREQAARLAEIFHGVPLAERTRPRFSQHRTPSIDALPPTLEHGEGGEGPSLGAIGPVDSRSDDAWPKSCTQQDGDATKAGATGSADGVFKKESLGMFLATRSGRRKSDARSPPPSPKPRLLSFPGRPRIRRDSLGIQTLDASPDIVAEAPRQVATSSPEPLSTSGLRPVSSDIPSTPPFSSLPEHWQGSPNADEEHWRKSSVSTDTSKESPKFVWIHVPANNPSWARKLLKALGLFQQEDFSELLNNTHWKSKHTRGRHSQHHACFLKTACAFTPLKPSYPPNGSSMHTNLYSCAEPSTTSLGSIYPPTPRGCLYLYLPFLHFDSYKMLLRRRDMIKRRLKQGRTSPVPRDVQDNPSFELRMIWEFLGHDPPINCRRTLDQYRYPSLRDTRARDDDQMLYKMTKQSAPPLGERKNTSFSFKNGIHWLGRQLTHGPDVGGGEREADHLPLDSDAGTGSESEQELDSDDGQTMPEVRDGNVLVVDQLWLWAMDTSKMEIQLQYLTYLLKELKADCEAVIILVATLVTFFPAREGNYMEGPLYQQADLRDSIFNQVNSDLTRHCENALDLAALTVLHAVSVLMDRSSHPDLEIFRIFEEAISVLTERMTYSLKRFRTAGFRHRHLDDDDDDGGGNDDVELKTSTIRARHREEDERDEEENQANTSALLELRDIEDELSTLKHLFLEQREQVNIMQGLYEAHFSPAPLPPPSASSPLERPSSAPVVPPSSTCTARTLHARPWSTLSGGSGTGAPSTSSSSGGSSSSSTSAPPGPASARGGKASLQEAEEKLHAYLNQADDMIERVKKTREDFDKLLTTVQRQAQIDEVRLSRQQADLASAQERSVMIFTVFTVIFLPLSFFSSIFGMNTYEWAGQSQSPSTQNNANANANNVNNNNNNPPHLRTIGVIALPASAALVLAALVIAWSTSMRRALSYAARGVNGARRAVARWCRARVVAAWYRADGTPRLLPVIPVQQQQRQQQRQQQQKDRKGKRRRSHHDNNDRAQKQNKSGRQLARTKTGEHDFWGKHRLESESDYEIPMSNLVRPQGRKSKADKTRR